MKKICESIGIEHDFHLYSEVMPVPLKTLEELLKKKKYRWVCTSFVEMSPLQHTSTALINF